MSITHANAVWRSSRPPFLLLTPICIALGAACAAYSGQTFAPVDLFIALIGGLGAHISVNTFNEYFDYDSGLDQLTQRTPFSGGSGSLPDFPAAKQWVWWSAWLTMAITIATGMYFLTRTGPEIIPLGILGLAIVYTYTQWINKQPWLCLIAPGLGFGPLMVIGTQVALTGTVSWLVCVAAMIPFFLISNLLLLNQLPDIEADRQCGRHHLAIAYGVPMSIRVYLIFALGALLTLIVGIGSGVLPTISAISALPMALSGWVFVKIKARVDQLPERFDPLIPYLGLNVVVALLAPALLALSLVV